MPRPSRRVLFLFGCFTLLTFCGLLAPGLSKVVAEAGIWTESGFNLRGLIMWLINSAGVGLRPAAAFAASQSRDLLVLLLSIGLGLPIMSRLGVTSKVLGFLAIGIVIGPSGFALISDVRWSETLAEAGILFFLCEMGLELSFDKLQKLRHDVFGLGMAQFVGTAVAIYGVAMLLLGLDHRQAIILGVALSLSSSVFALQVLDDAKERGSTHGRSAFGILLFQDIVVPFLLVLLPMLGTGSPQEIVNGVKRAGVNAILALAPLFLGGRYLLGKLFSSVAESENTVALRALSFFTVLGMCYMFQVFSLSNTLGAFLAGVLLAETAYHEQVVAAISPIREDLLGLFFITVGFGIDLRLMLAHPFLVLSAVSGLLLCKVAAITCVCKLYGMSLANSQRTGFLLCQAGEFAFVMFGIAREVGAFTTQQTKLLLTVTSLSMACTPLLAKLGREFSALLQMQRLVGSHADSSLEGRLRETVQDARIIVCGYGRVGTMVTELLDTKFISWVAFDADPQLVAEARSRSLPVFLGDLPNVGPQSMNVRDTIALDADKIAVVTPMKPSITIRIVQGLRQVYPELTILARATSSASAQELRRHGAEPFLPGLYGDTFLMNLPIGAAVLKGLGLPEEDAEAVVDDLRREHLIHEVPSGGALAGLAQWYQGEQIRVQARKDAEASVVGEEGTAPI